MPEAREHGFGNGHVQFTDNGIQSSPTDQLPHEILLQIFWLALETDIILRGRAKRNFLTLITLSHVCRRWRDITINTSALWASFNFCPSPLRDVCLVRSKAAPLSLSGRLTAENSPDHHAMISFISEHMHRLQTLNIRLAPADPSPPPLNFTSAPMLRSIVLGSSHARIPLSDSFRGYLPCLKEVSLIRFTVTWSPPPFPSRLTHLRLAEVGRPSLDILIETLRSLSPTLVSLNLDSCLPTSPQASSHEIDLPMLQNLRLHDVGSTCALFLHYVTFPKATLLKIIYLPDVIEPKHVAAFAKHSAVQAQLARSLYLSQKRLCFVFKASPQHMGDLSSSEWHRSSYSAEFIFHSIVCSTNKPRPVYPHIIHEACRHTSNITSCFITGDYEPRDWSSMLASLLNLQYLTIGGFILQALIDCFLEADDDATPQSCYPKLPSLAVVSIAPLPPTATRTFTRLLELLKDREDLGVPLKTLYIEADAETLPFNGDDDGIVHFAGTLSYKFRITEVIGRDSKKRVWFHWIPVAVDGGDGVSRP